MSSDASLVLEVMPAGPGTLLDLGGGPGQLRQPSETRGYRYVNLDLRVRPHAEPSVIGDAHRLPFRDAVFDLVVSKETLEHFVQPDLVIDEVWRVLKANGRLIVLVPFLHPFHADDFYRYTPLGLQHLLRAFHIERFDSPLWIFTLVSLGLAGLLQRARLGRVGGLVRSLGRRLDGLVMRRRPRPAGFAAAYRVVALKRPNGRSASGPASVGS